jgi:hypothetical protein
MNVRGERIPPSSTCGRARRLLWSDDELRMLTPELVAARAHVDTCRDCGDFLNEMRALRDLTRASTGDSGEVAPVATRERLFQAIAQRRATLVPPKQLRRSSLRPAAVVAALVLASVFGVVWQLQRTETPAQPAFVAALADDHARRLSGDEFRSSDPEQVTRWLAERVAIPLFVPTFDHAELAGARVHVRDGRRGAVVEYSAGSRAVSYFVVPLGTDVGAETVAPDSEAAGDVSFRHVAHSGYGVVFWQHGDVLHAFVGDLHPSGLEELAKSCVQQARAAMHVMAFLQ